MIRVGDNIFTRIVLNDSVISISMNKSDWLHYLNRCYRGNIIGVGLLRWNVIELIGFVLFTRWLWRAQKRFATSNCSVNRNRQLSSCLFFLPLSLSHLYKVSRCNSDRKRKVNNNKKKAMEFYQNHSSLMAMKCYE